MHDGVVSFVSRNLACQEHFRHAMRECGLLVLGKLEHAVHSTSFWDARLLVLRRLHERLHQRGDERLDFFAKLQVYLVILVLVQVRDAR